jgi:hypothetical protein
MYLAVYGIVVFAGLAMMVREGLWSNTLALINVIVSGLVAFGFYSPLVAYLDEEVTSGQHTYWLDFAIIWALYAVTMIVLRSLMAAASKLCTHRRCPKTHSAVDWSIPTLTRLRPLRRPTPLGCGSSSE